MKITTAVIPIAGKGTRFLPATKQTPKEMLPILTKPMIQYVVEEAVNSGIERIIFVTSTGKSSIEDYFDRNLELEGFLENAGKSDQQELIKKIGSMVETISVRQKQQLGLGHAVLMAKDLIQPGEKFAVILADDIVMGDNPVTKQLIETQERQNCNCVIGVMEVPNEHTSKYGIIDGTEIEKKTYKMTNMVEKPSPKDAPTNLATPGRYILPHEIFEILERIPKGAGGEYQLTDAINVLAEKGEAVAYIFDGDRYDAGTVEGYLDATLEFALRDASLKQHAINLMKEKLERYQ